MIKGKTSSGFEYVIDDMALNNYELFDAISEVKQNPVMMPRIVKLMLGEEQKNKLIDHVRDENGIATIEAMESEIMDIMQSHNQVKNS